MGIHAITDTCKDSLTSLNVSGCKSITSDGFKRLESCTKIKHLNISYCTGTEKLISCMTICFAGLQSFHMRKCGFISTDTNAIRGFHQLRFLEELNLSEVPVANIENLSTFQQLRVI